MHFQVFTGAVPFSGLSNAAVLFSTLRGLRPGRPTDPTFTDDLWSLTQSCWDVTLELRPPSSEVLGTLEVYTCRRLTDHTLNKPEHICLINTIFSDHDWTKVANRLHDNYAQKFVNVVDAVSRQTIQQLGGQADRRPAFTQLGTGEPCTRNSQEVFICFIYVVQPRSCTSSVAGSPALL